MHNTTMRLETGIYLLLSIVNVVASAAGTQVQKRALGLADIPPCGVCYPAFKHPVLTLCSSNVS